MQKSHKISLFKILQLFYHVASQTSSIFTCNICTKYHGLFSGYFLTIYAFQALILLAFWRSFQRVPWQTDSDHIFIDCRNCTILFHILYRIINSLVLLSIIPFIKSHAKMYLHKRIIKDTISSRIFTYDLLQHLFLTG